MDFKQYFRHKIFGKIYYRSQQTIKILTNSSPMNTGKIAFIVVSNSAKINKLLANCNYVRTHIRGRCMKEICPYLKIFL